MSRTVCRQCPDCGLYNDITVEVCKCGKNLLSERQNLMYTYDVPAGQRGEIDETLELYVKKCSECGTLNFSADPKFPEKRCFNCTKARLFRVAPKLYVEEEPTETDKSVKADNVPAKTDEPKTVSGTPVPHWGDLLKGINGAAGSSSPSKDTPKDVTVTNPKPQPTSKSAPKKDLRLTAVRYGEHSFTIPEIVAAASPVMLGKEAHQGKFLSQDGRVSRKHCTVYIKNGKWYVTDNCAANGTFVNNRDIGEGGTALLSDGDFLKLGHNEDSMEFKVSFV